MVQDFSCEILVGVYTLNSKLEVETVWDPAASSYYASSQHMLQDFITVKKWHTGMGTSAFAFVLIFKLSEY